MAKRKARKAGARAESPARPASVSVTLKRARNGYVVSTWSDRLGRDVAYIAKTKKEAQGYASRLLRGA